jgi:hypothetical protein
VAISTWLPAPDRITFYTTNAFQSTFGGSQDGVVIKIDPSLTTVLFSSFLGGSGDGAYVLALSPINEIFI